MSNKLMTAFAISALIFVAGCNMGATKDQKSSSIVPSVSVQALML